MSEKYLIWSNEHRAWWGPNNAGYTKHLEAAGRYSREDAIRQSAFWRDGWGSRDIPAEIPVREADAVECRRLYIDMMEAKV